MTTIFKMISFRVRHETVELLDRLVATQTGSNFPNTDRVDFTPLNRSEMLRLALTTGLDYLACSPPKHFERVKQCRSSATKPQPKPPPTESASSGRRRRRP